MKVSQLVLSSRGPARPLHLDSLSSPDFFYDALQHFSTADNVEDITALCRLHCKQLGFDYFVYALRIPTQFTEARVIMLKGYPDAWLEHYWENGYAASDPAVIYCGKHIVPIEWHGLAFEKPSLNAQVMNEAADFGLKSGISMPIHSPHGELGILSFSLNRNDASRRIGGKLSPIHGFSN